MLSVYHVMCFTPVVVDIDTRIYIGYSFIALILAHTLASLGILVWSMIKDSLWELKKSRVIKHALIRERTRRIELQDQKKKIAKAYVNNRGHYASKLLNVEWTRR